MAHERLHNSHIFAVSLQQSTERMAKRMPTQTFGYFGSNGRWPDVVSIALFGHRGCLPSMSADANM
jgi:hypothetical protein